MKLSLVLLGALFMTGLAQASEVKCNGKIFEETPGFIKTLCPLLQNKKYSFDTIFDCMEKKGENAMSAIAKCADDYGSANYKDPSFVTTLTCNQDNTDAAQKWACCYMTYAEEETKLVYPVQLIDIFSVSHQPLSYFLSVTQRLKSITLEWLHDLCLDDVHRNGMHSAPELEVRCFLVQAVTPEVTFSY